MTTKTLRVTGSDGKEYDLTYDLVSATIAPATIVPESWKFVSMVPVVVAPPPVVVPPPIPPPVVSTDGKIVNFSAISGMVAMTIGGQSTKNLNTNATSANAWSIAKIDDYTMRYEVRSGDVAKAANGWVDSSTSERSETELMPRYPAGVKINISYGFILHTGSPNTSQWVVIGQCHFDKGSGSPPFAIALFGEKMTVICRGPTNFENRVYQDPSPIQRGRKYVMRVELFFNGNGTGTCKVWRDEILIANFVGALGSGVSGDTHYFKQGVYRNHAAESLAATYSNTLITSA